MVRTIQLEESNHANAMFRDIREMKHDEEFCDFTIKVKDHEYLAHKLVLSAGSPYFKAMLKHNTKESQSSEVVMKDVDAECVKICIDFLYTAKFDIADGMRCDLLHVATIMQLEKVKEAIGDVILEELNTESFYNTKNIAETFGLEGLLLACKIYFEKNLLAISTRSDFENESVGTLIEVFKSKELNMSEEEKLSVSLRWVGKDVEKNEFLFDLLKLVKFELVPSEIVSDLLDKHHFISNDFRIYKMMTAPMIKFAKKSSVNINNKMMILFDKDSDCIRSYNPTTNEVPKINHESFKHFGHLTAVAIDPYVYILCEDKSVHRLNFRFGNSKWERMKDMTISRGRRVVATSLSGSIFVIGSLNLSRRTVERFDPDENRWVQLQDKPVPVAVPALLPLNNSIYCIGGIQGSQCVTSFCKFTPSTSEWHDLQPMNHKRGYCAAVAADQKIYVAGGVESQSNVGLNVVDYYDILSRQWTTLPSVIPEKISLCTIHHYGGWIYIVPLKASSRHIKKYNIVSDTWHHVEWDSDEVCFHVADAVTAHAGN